MRVWRAPERGQNGKDPRPGPLFFIQDWLVPNLWTPHPVPSNLVLLLQFGLGLTLPACAQRMCFPGESLLGLIHEELHVDAITVVQSDGSLKEQKGAKHGP